VVWARDAAKAADYAERMTGELGCPVRVADSAEACVRDAQVVVTTTPARAPLIEAGWLHPGLHITAMGSDAAEKNEIAPAALAVASRFVCDRHSQSEALGELRAAIAAGQLPKTIDELGEICAGTKPGRDSGDDKSITICDLTGTGVQDTAIATLAHARAVAQGMGSVISS
jgi:ornithine cyclodeaminase